MARDPIGGKVLAQFREFLAERTLKEIDIAFESAEIERVHDHLSTASGQRRQRFDQYLASIDTADASDAARLVSAIAVALERDEQQRRDGDTASAASQTRTLLVSYLREAGFQYLSGRLHALNRRAKLVLEGDAQEKTITEVTRRRLFDALSDRQISWSGRLSESDFLSRLYPLKALPSDDRRLDSMLEDVRLHRERHQDWPPEWVYSDPRLNLLQAPDEELLAFFALMLSPIVYGERSHADQLVDLINRVLAPDGWMFVVSKMVSGQPEFTFTRRANQSIDIPEIMPSSDPISEGYVEELAKKCDHRLAVGDYEGAVTLARTQLEAVLEALEFGLTGDKSNHRGELAVQFKKVAKLLRMDDQRSDLDDRFKDVIRGLIQVVNGIAPLRNKISDGHARVRKPAPHHAHLIVNAAKTVAAFLVESYVFQRSHGMLPNSGSS
jgi:hypothetical protein